MSSSIKALASTSQWKEAEEAFLLITSEKIKADYTYLSWLSRCREYQEECECCVRSCVVEIVITCFKHVLMHLRACFVLRQSIYLQTSWIVNRGWPGNSILKWKRRVNRFYSFNLSPMTATRYVCVLLAWELMIILSETVCYSSSLSLLVYLCAHRWVSSTTLQRPLMFWSVWIPILSTGRWGKEI